MPAGTLFSGSRVICRSPAALFGAFFMSAAQKMPQRRNNALKAETMPQRQNTLPCSGQDTGSRIQIRFPFRMHFLGYLLRSKTHDYTKRYQQGGLHCRRQNVVFRSSVPLFERQLNVYFDDSAEPLAADDYAASASETASGGEIVFLPRQLPEPKLPSCATSN